MNKMLLAAVAVMALGMGSAFAAGAPGYTAPTQYGSQAFPNQTYHTRTVFSEIFGHRDHAKTATPRSAEGRAPGTAGG